MNFTAWALRTVFCTGALLFSAPNAFAAFRIDAVADGVYVHPGQHVALTAQGHDDIANIGFIVGEKCVAVIDTGGSVRIGRALRDAIRAKTKTPICYVIDTHVHVDHVLGNVAFAGDKPTFIGSATLPAAIARSRDFFIRNYAADLDSPATANQIIGPTETIETTREIDLGGRTIVLHAWPKAHTDSDLTIYDATSETLWTGDLLFVDRVPALDGSLKGWIAALDEMTQMHPAHVVPGHGAVGSDLRAMLAPERRYLTALLDGVRAAIAKGQSLDEAAQTVGVEEKTKWLLFETAHPRNVSRAYQELEWE